MSGHSKWHNIRIRKGRQDAIRGKLFTKLAREITVSAKEGGGSPDANARLRSDRFDPADARLRTDGHRLVQYVNE